MSRVLLSGVHGVGKSYFVEHRIKEKYSIEVLSASQLISKYHDAEDAGDKKVKDIDLNQAIIASELYKIKCSKSNDYILDGHLIIINKDGNLERIPYDFFKSELLDSVILLVDDVDVIYNRMKKRDGYSKISKEMIEKIQKSEIDYALELKEKDIEIRIINPQEEDDSFSDLLR